MIRSENAVTVFMNVDFVKDQIAQDSQRWNACTSDSGWKGNVLKIPLQFVPSAVLCDMWGLWGNYVRWGNV